MSSGATQYSFWTPYPDMLQRGRGVRVQMPVWRDGAAVAPTVDGSSYSLIAPDGTAVVDEEAISLVDDVATYDIDAAELPATLAYGPGYQQVWDLVLPDGSTRTVDREASVCPRPLYPPCRDRDLLNEYPNLATLRGPTTPSFQTFIDQAWNDIVQRLWMEGRLPYQIKSAGAILLPHRELSLAKFFSHLHISAQRGNYETIAAKHEGRYGGFWSKITWTEDRNDDGRVDDPTERVGGATIVQVNAAPMYRRRTDPRW